MICTLMLALPLLSCACAMDNLTVAFRWKHLSFEYPSEEIKNNELQFGKFIPEYNVPLGLEVHGDRLFFTIPKWKNEGVPASLAYIKLTDPIEAPLLRPYPNWEAHNKPQPEVVSPSRARADGCGRLWVMDMGLVNILSNETVAAVTPRVVVYNLTTDEVIFSYTIPNDQYDKTKSFFTNIAVEENDCSNSFAYLADLGRPALVVYDLAQNKSWLVNHYFFNVDPLAGNFNVSGLTFEWSEGLTGLALSGKHPEGHSSLYFHPLSSFSEFNVSTEVLQNETLATNSEANYGLFHQLGSRGPRAQSAASFLHRGSGVLFYSLVNLNAVACWRTTLPRYTMESQGRVFMSDTAMVFPSDIKVDADDTLWVLSNRLPAFLYHFLDGNEYNFRVLRSSVKDAIRGTTCDSKIVLDPVVLGNITKGASGNGASGLSSFGVVLVAVNFMVVAFR